MSGALCSGALLLGRHSGGQAAGASLFLCSCSRYTSAEAAEVIHHPHSLLSTLFAAVLFQVFFPFEVLKVAKLSLAR